MYALFRATLTPLYYAGIMMGREDDAPEYNGCFVTDM
jgi:hypothetical protein